MLFTSYFYTLILTRPWMQQYNSDRPHSGKYCYGKTPMETFKDSLSLAKEKLLNYTCQAVAE